MRWSLYDNEASKNHKKFELVSKLRNQKLTCEFNKLLEKARKQGFAVVAVTHDSYGGIASVYLTAHLRKK